MIVVAGNWLISDGSLLPPPARGLFEPLLGEIPRLACLAGVGEDGRYRPTERIDVVLAGDTFDGLTSQRWIGRVRPWHAGAARRETADRVLWDAIRLGRGPLARLGKIAQRGIRVPAADQRQRPVLSQSVPVGVGVTVLVGDRDGVLERPLVAAAARYGFCLGSCWERIGNDGTRVMIRHGHEFDPLCGIDVDEPCGGIDREPARFGRRPSVSESLAIDLLAVFAAGLADTSCPKAVTGRIVRDIAIGPWTAAPEILGRHLLGGSLPAIVASDAVDAWRRSLDHWHAAATANPPFFATGFDTVDALASWMQRVNLTMHGPPCEGASGPCADGWLDIRRKDLVTTAPQGGLAVLGHPPRRLSSGPIVAIGPASDGDPGMAAEAIDSHDCDHRPVVEIHPAERASAEVPAWVVIPRSAGKGGIVSSNEWTRAAA